jgi:hypothetical protein
MNPSRARRILRLGAPCLPQLFLIAFEGQVYKRCDLERAADPVTYHAAHKRWRQRRAR